MRKQINLFIIIFMALLSMQLSGQSFIGSFNIYQNNGAYYHNAGNNATNKVDTKHIILKYEENTPSATITSFEQSKNLSLRSIHDEYYIYIIPNNTTYISYCQNLEQASIVDYIEVSLYFEFHGGLQPNDPYISDQYYLDLLNVYEAWGITTGNHNIVVAILDTGLEFDVEEFGPENPSNNTVSNLFNNTGEDAWTPDWDDPDDGDGDDGPDQNSYIDDWMGYDFCDLDYSGGMLNYNKDNDVMPSSPGSICSNSNNTDTRHGT